MHVLIDSIFLKTKVLNGSNELMNVAICIKGTKTWGKDSRYKS